MIKAQDVVLRSCRTDDAALLYDWRNDPEIVSRSTKKVTVDWDEHQAWLASCLSAPDEHAIYIIEAQKKAVGVVRFDRYGEGAAVVSIMLDPHARGHGFGTSALACGTERIVSVWEDLKSVEAFLLEGNDRAIRAFERAGYRKRPASNLEGHLQFQFPCRVPC